MEWHFLRSVGGPPPGTDWNALQHEIFHVCSVRVQEHMTCPLHKWNRGQCNVWKNIGSLLRTWWACLRTVGLPWELRTPKCIGRSTNTWDARLNNCAAGNDVKAFFQALDAESCKSLCREFLNFANGSYINVCLLHKFTTVSFCCVTPVPNKPPIVAYRLQFNSISIQLSWGNRGVGACISVDLALDKRSCRFR